MLTRLQDSLQIFLIPTSNFHETHLRDNQSDDDETMEPFHRVSLPCIRLLREEDVQFWVQVHDYFELLTNPWHPVHPATTSVSPDGAETTTEVQQAHITFVWASHRSGHLHLYLMQRTWPKSAVVCANARTNHGVAEIIDAQEVFTSQLTNGLWEVTGDRSSSFLGRSLVYCRTLFASITSPPAVRLMTRLLKKFDVGREHIPSFPSSYAVSYASGTRGKLTRLTPLKPDAQFGDVQPSPGYGAPTDEESCYDPYFPVSGTQSYPLSFKLSAFDPASGWAVVSSSSLNRTTGVQVVKIHHTLTESSACGKNLAMMHVAWLRHHSREHIPSFPSSYAVSYASGTRGKLTRLTPLKPDAQFGDVQPSPGYGAPTDEESCYDPYFPVSGTTSYPLSFKLSAFDPASGWAVVSSSSLNRTTGVQVVKIHHTLTESSACGKNLAMIHVAWLRHHIPHEQVLPNQLRPCDPPRVVRFDIEHQPNPSGTIDESAGFSDSPIARPPQQSSTYLYGLLFTPKQPKPAGGYPTVHFVYGGPGVQLVLGTYAKVTLMHALVYCHFGYAVFLCDCRGSSNRGIQFAGHIKNQLGLPELDDHVAFLKHVAQKTGLIDLSRVAITGNSYGGYMSLMAAMRYSDVYRASVAGSPVVDWTLYDTAYTERYMGLPRDNPIGYWNGNVLRYVEQLPADEVRLIICHGALDENVHFVHTSRLVHKLESSGKPFKLLYYPTSRHGIKEYEHMEASLLQLFERVLRPR
ncbi:hypothetical protein T265_02749 [Opisthorchis viverrini]|uniref:Peptidase S9 prolyl oligopeptidase catalytic domain-containing protein n=1 Tax=Opisthorchis viverrini TaxID=6198 RepID=A0A075AI34_OPIVI|nr:hypothetical protein T265_02749 [Opisthorchis viverrini]KER30939.1 hypothetical protein T265_02749 [Opisthorchis viverrini]